MTSATDRNAGVLLEIIRTVSSSLELDEVLRAVVRLLSDASAVHACFVYLTDASGASAERLVLRAAGEPYGHLVERVVLERGEGLAWWAAERKEPAHIRDNLLGDPRSKYVPELDEERFQSLLCVPILARDESLVGVISVHTEAPREFTQAEIDFLVSSASLVGGAIENARLYTEMRTRVHELEQLTELGEAIAAAELLADLLPDVTERSRRLLQAESCHLYLLEGGSEELLLRASAPPGSETRDSIGLAELGPELRRRGRASRLAVPLVAADELVGLLVANGSVSVDLGRAVASQTAVGIKKIELIERLTERNLVKDFFDELAGGRVLGDLEGRAARVGFELERPHLVLIGEPADEQLERALSELLPGSLFDRREHSLRALLRVPTNGGDRLVEGVRRAHERVRSSAAVGLSSPCVGASSYADGFEQARQAVLGTSLLRRAPDVTTFEELGAYKYLLKIAREGAIRDATIDAVTRIADYDRQRGSSLLPTLEEFLRRRGNISSTSEALFVHANTLRQRLRRIAELSGLDLRRDDWLMIEIAVKMVRLQAVLGPATSDTPTG